MGQNINEINSTNPEDIEAINVLVREIIKAVRGNVVNCDRTYRTVIKRIDKSGYVITDQAGQERTVPCGIPNIELRPGQSVYVKEPMGKINELHICNLVGNMSNSTKRRRR